jgi:hypothetical protein
LKSNRILTPKVISTLECNSSFTDVTKLKTTMLIAGLLTGEKIVAQIYAGDVRNYCPVVRVAPPYLIDIWQ